MSIDYDASYNLYRKGKEEMSVGNIDKAINLFKESISAFPHNKTLEMLGECLLINKRYPDAVVYLAASVTLGPNQARALYLLARALLQIGLKDDAIKHLKKSIIINPNYKSAIQLIDHIDLDSRQKKDLE